VAAIEPVGGPLADAPQPNGRVRPTRPQPIDGGELVRVDLEIPRADVYRHELAEMRWLDARPHVALVQRISTPSEFRLLHQSTVSHAAMVSRPPRSQFGAARGGRRLSVRTSSSSSSAVSSARGPR